MELTLWYPNNAYRATSQGITLCKWELRTMFQTIRCQVLCFIKRETDTQRVIQLTCYHTASKLGDIFLIFLLFINPTFITERRAMH